MALTLRTARGPEDLLAMQALVRALWQTRIVECLPADIDWRAGIYLNGTFPETSITLCEEHGRLRGFAWCIKDSLVDLVTGDPRAAELLVPAGDVTAYALASNAMLRGALAAKGLRPAGHDYLCFARTLADERSSAPPGYRFADMRALDVAARAALHRAAFGSARMTTERYGRVMASAHYDPALDLVAVSAQGEPAAFVLGWHDRALGVGLCEPVGTHPDHRKRGLARALLHETLARFAARGARTVYIGAEADDPVTPGLYAGVGFTLVDRNLGHRRA